MFNKAKQLSKYFLFASTLMVAAVTTLAGTVSVQAGKTLGAGDTDTVIPVGVTEGRAGSTDIRFKTNSGNLYTYNNGANNPAYTLQAGEVNPSQGNPTEAANRRVTSRHDLYVFHDRYELENPDTENGTFSYILKLFCNAGCTLPTDNIEIVSITNRWDTDGDPATLEQTDLMTGGKGVDTTTPGELTLSVTPFATCTVTTGSCPANPTINGGAGGANYAGQFGWVSVVFGIRQGSNLTSTTIDGLSEQTYSAFGSAANGNSLRAYVTFTLTNDQLDPAIIPGAQIRNSAGTGNPVIGDTTYSVQVGGSAGTPITAVDGQPLNAPNGACSVVVGGTTYTSTGGIVNGACRITGIPLTTNNIPGGTVNITDGGTPRPITMTTTYPGLTAGPATVLTPTIAITSPTPNSSVSPNTPTNITVNTTPPAGETITGVSFIVDGVEVGTDTTGPEYSFNWTPAGTPGPRVLTARATSSGGGVTTSAPVTVNFITPITSTDVPGLTVNCNPARINSTTTCTFTLPPFRSLPADFRLSIGGANATGTCTANGSAVTCTGVSTGSVPGTQNIFGNTGGVRTDTGERVVISDNVSLIPTGGFLWTSLGGLIVAGILGFTAFKVVKKRNMQVKTN